MKPHKHADIIKAWADGHIIQLKSSKLEWMDVECATESCLTPSFNSRWEYRIKPEPTDLEKYGVEVGDVWTSSIITGKNHLVVRVVLPTKVVTCMERLIHKEDLSQLLFRRGEVNKL